MSLADVPKCLADLTRIATAHGPTCLTLAGDVLNHPDFALWPGSNSPDKHHGFEGGLVVHTYEVALIAATNNLLLGEQVNPVALFLACLYHDIGKVRDYVYTIDERGAKWWKSSPHHRLINHVNRSAVIWSQAVEAHGIGRDIEDDVLHAILAHHGVFGSSVQPKTKLAWLLHLADQTSARMEDADRLDLGANKPTTG